MTDPEVSFELPPRHTVLRSFAGHLEAPPETVFGRLLAALMPAPSEGVATINRHFRADPAERLIVVQGDWWYRGEYRVLAEEEGSLVQYEIINVAQAFHAAGALTARSELRAAPRAFQTLLTKVGGPLAR
ncbi:hypothetical protein QN345_12250 [Cryobacterium sp. 10I1]|uniref:hypothetical protein n=1 Tax=Cryobacterium sp. 10I1 TaxID=3048578 RepID=UPI002B237CA4|nr:hypothetical protein [Cryobacterium sp. 10I1]MEB0306076.1 hypothetical protein [Cryobacterium sp. 10I1]